MTLAEWLRGYRLRRRGDLGTDEAFEKHMGILFGVSAFVKLQGWKRADLLRDDLTESGDRGELEKATGTSDLVPAALQSAIRRTGLEPVTR